MTAEWNARYRARWGMHATMVLFLFAVVAVEAKAQLPTATILGVVKDSTGAVVPDANLTARNVDTGQTRTTVSGGDGSYRMPALPVGNYSVRVEHPGFQADVRSGLTLTVSQEVVANFALQVGAMAQTVSVTADAPLVNTTTGSLGGLVNEQKVAELPLNGRNFIDLTLLQTGVALDKNHTGTGPASGTWYSSNGAPPRSNTFLLDGAIMGNAYAASAGSVSGSSLGIEGIREYRVVTNFFSAEYGLTMGSQMLIVTKGGTNSFHGSLFEYLRNSALDARNFFDYKTVAIRRRLPEYQRNQFGGSLGGPLKKDKTFFFATYEGLRQRLGVTTVDDVIPPASKADGGLVQQIAPAIKPLLALFPDPNLPNNRFTYPFSQPTGEDYGQIRADQNFSTHDNAFVRYTVDDNQITYPQSYPQFFGIRSSRNQFGTLSENHVFSPSLLSSFRFSFSRTAFRSASSPGFLGPQFSFIPGAQMGTISIGQVTMLGPDATTPGNVIQNILTWSDDVFYTRGRHSLKLGTLINRYRIYLANPNNYRGALSFANIQNFLLGQATSYTAQTPGSISDRTYSYSTVGFYGQDDLRISSRLTLNLGLRYEFLTQPQEVRGHGAALRDVQHDAKTTLGPPFKNPSLKNFSPRFGFAWDVQGDGKTAVRAGFGLLYDIATFGSSLNIAAAGTPPFSSSSTVTNPPPIVSLPLFFPPSSIGKAVRTVDYLLPQPHLLQYNLTIERQLPWSTTVMLAYGGSRGINILRTVEGNPTVPQILPDGRQFWPVGAPRTNPAWGTIEFKTGGSNSWYHSLQFGVAKRLTKGLQFQSSYTWSKLLDETQSQLSPDDASGSIFGSDPNHPPTDKGPASFDITQVWRFNAIYRIPSLHASGISEKAFSGWWLSGILSLQSGYPFTVALNSNRSRSGVNGGAAAIDRPDLVPGRNHGNIVSGATAGCSGVAPGRQLGTPILYFDPCAFTIPAAGFLGTAGRSILRGPGLENLDFSLVKDTAIRHLGEGGKLEFRAEVFNILNRPNFLIPNRIVFAATQNAEPAIPNAGQIAGTATTSRQIQFALKLLF